MPVLPDDHEKQRQTPAIQHPRNTFLRRYVGPKRQEKKAIEVFVEAQVRQEIKALAFTKGMGSQEYIERLIVKEIEAKPNLVAKGLQMLERNEKKPYRSKVRILEEENERLKKALESMSKTGRHR